MSDDNLARRVRDYARGPGRAAINVSSAWLAREFDVDPRTVAAALRPCGVRPGPVEPGVRGYGIRELAAIRFDDDPVQIPPDVYGDGPWPELVDPALDNGSGKPCRPIPYEPEPDALERLSAGAGHDMTPALRAAGLL